jgi:hypothetical protein
LKKGIKHDEEFFKAVAIFSFLLNHLINVVFYFFPRPLLSRFGTFTAPHGPEFFTAPNIFLRPLLSKGAVTTATWQPWPVCRVISLTSRAGGSPVLPNRFTVGLM